MREAPRCSAGESGAVSRRVGATAQLALVDGVVSDDQGGQSDGDHRWWKEGQAPGHLGDHQHQSEWGVSDAAEARDHSHDDERCWDVGHAGCNAFEDAPQPEADESADDHARPEDTPGPARSDGQ